MRALVMSTALQLSRYGINRVARKRMRGKLLVLCYHGVVAEDHADRFRYENTVSLREFRRQIEFVCRHYKPISVADLVDSRTGKRSLAPNAALITFDDGYRNNLVAAEALRQLGVPCVFHLTANHIGTNRILWTDEVMNRVLAWPSEEVPLPGDAAPARLPSTAQRRRIAWSIKERCKRVRAEELQDYLDLLRATPVEPLHNDELFGFLDWEHVRTLARYGFEIGSHTLDHPILTRVAPERLDKELIESKRRIEAEIGKPCRCVAYPNGGPEDVSQAVILAARRAGYDVGFTIAEHFSDPTEDLLAISRICVQGHLATAVFEFHASGADGLFSRFR